jgi:hypothetical protein
LGFIFGFGMGRRMDEWAKSQHCLGIVAVNSDEGNGPKGRMNLSKADEGRREEEGGGRSGSWVILFKWMNKLGRSQEI